MHKCISALFTQNVNGILIYQDVHVYYINVLIIFYDIEKDKCIQGVGGNIIVFIFVKQDKL